MRCLVLILLLICGCGDRTPRPAPIANAAGAPPDAAPAVDAATLSAGGCCQSGVWACNRMPNPGECPGSGL